MRAIRAIYGPGANNKLRRNHRHHAEQAVGSEDCLYLNVWRPPTDDSNLPVIVFFHGGSNVSGYTADPVYDGAALAKAANAIVVTPNFRLGILGFLNLPQLKTGDAATTRQLHAARQHQGAAVRAANAAAFGGNPGERDHLGQSAGAINVWALQTSPMMAAANPKLFHRVMPLSGGISLASNLPPGSVPTLSPASTYLTQGNTLLQNLVIGDGLPRTPRPRRPILPRNERADADYMRSKTPAQLFTTLLTRLAR